MMILSLFISFIITVILGPIFIPLLKRMKFGQSIREEGPEAHLKKSGTPTMGGVMIILSVLLTALIFVLMIGDVKGTYGFWLILLVILGYGLLGFLDDFIIVVLKRNLGLTSLQKLLGQIVIAFVFCYVIYTKDFDTSLQIPGTDLMIPLGWAYFGLVLFMLVGASNAVNLTDGLDGLLAGTATIAFLSFGIIGSIVNYTQGIQVYDASIIMMNFIVSGALLGFLVFNKNPAKVFMGDTGSLALGAGIAAVAILMKLEILLVIIGMVFVIETLSVIIQVISFKTTGKRVFKMSPIHHHFELVGWSEWRVVITFWLVGLICGLLGILIEVL